MRSSRPNNRFEADRFARRKTPGKPAEVVYPGTWLDLPDRDLAFELEGMLRHLEDRVAEAAIALTMFEASIGSRVDPQAEWERDARIRQQVEDELRTELGDTYFREFDKYRFESERRVLRKKADLGVTPRSYSHKVPFIHAHSFVYAVDSFGNSLTSYVITTCRRRCQR